MEEFTKGCLKGKYDIRDYKLKKKVSMACLYPDEYTCPGIITVKNQGAVCSCVAHASSTILEYHEGEIMSTDFIYGIHNKLYGSKGPGMYLREACKILHDYGDVKKELCPTNTEVDKVYSISELVFNDTTKMEDAFKHRITSYARLFTDNDIKYSLMNYGPVLCSVLWYDDNKLKNNILQKGKYNPGGHALTLCGWNKEGWVIQNSWGSGYGMNGRFILPYSYKIEEAYSFVPDDGDIIKPKQNSIIDLIYKLINFIINLFY